MLGMGVGSDQASAGWGDTDRNWWGKVKNTGAPHFSWPLMIIGAPDLCFSFLKFERTAQVAFWLSFRGWQETYRLDNVPHVGHIKRCYIPLIAVCSSWMFSFVMNMILHGWVRLWEISMVHDRRHLFGRCP